MEVESRVKLNIGERERLIGELAARQISLTAPVLQRDVYFKERGFRDHVHGPGSAIARVRYTPSETTLNMKRLTSHDGVWEEIETRIQDGIVAERIMDAMGAELAVVVKKTRRSGHFGEIEIQIDDVEGLGAYLELAVLADEEIGRARKSIDRLLRELDIPSDRVELRGYPVILLERQGVSFSAK
ncbi:MAG: class IV adenylate cyclase [Pseudonocardiaceae bacterium]